MHSRHTLRRLARASVDYLDRVRYERKCRLYCVGTAKSGTHSIATMFDRSVRSIHEPDGLRTVQLILDISSGRISRADLPALLRQRDERIRLDVDSSQLNFFILDSLLAEFSEARFLLTIRDCYSWLDSFINDSLRREIRPEWVQLRRLRFSADRLPHPEEEKVLREMSLYTLDGYLSYWANHNEEVLAKVPPEQLLIVRTDQISERTREIATFAGLPYDSISVDHTHSFANPQKYGVLHKIDRAYLEAKVEEHCAPLMARFFAEIQSLTDAGGLDLPGPA